MQKVMSEVIDVYKFGQEIHHIWHFLEIFVQISKNFTLMKIFCCMLKINLHILLDKKHFNLLAICNEYLLKY